MFLTVAGGVIFLSPFDQSQASVIYSEDMAFNGLVDNCRFEDNFGSAILWIGSNGTISNSKFYNNAALELGSVTHIGHNLKIEHSEFVNNTALGGGALVLESLNTTVDDCLFDSNSGLELGGAIAIVIFSDEMDSFDDSFILIKNSKFTNNTASLGGAIFALGFKTSIEDSVFEDNSGLIGGAILWLQNEGKISNSNFTENSAILGGAISVGPYASFVSFLNSNDNSIGWDVAFFEDSSVVECNFVNNTAQYASGVLWVDNNGLVENSTFDGNHFEKFSLEEFEEGIAGKIQYLFGSFIDGAIVGDEVDDLVMDIVQVIDGYFLQANGAALYWIGENGAVNNCTFINNDATTLPMVEYIQNVTFVFEKDLDKFSYVKSQTYFEYLKDMYREEYFKLNNEWYYEGIPTQEMLENDLSHWLVNNIYGHVFIKWYNETSGNWSVNAFRFECYENSTYDWWYGNTYYYFTFPVVGNSYYEYQDNPEETQDNPEETQDNPEETQDNPQEYDDYGFVLFKEWGQIYVIWSHYFESEISTPSCGGAIYWRGQNGSVNNSRFINNSADDAGAIFVGADENEEASCKINDSKFINNTAKNGGGAIVLNGANGYVNNSEFINNEVIPDSENVQVDIYGMQLNGGGAIIWIGPNGIIDNSNFTNNNAEYGGAIVVYALNFYGEIYSFSDNLTIKNSNFDDNTARFGGAIDWAGYDGKIINSSFNKNQATYGGAVLAELSGIYIEGNFTNNVASNGGALLIIDNDAQIIRSIFKFNSADKGGAISIDGNNTSISYAEFINNTALQGGAIFWSDNGGSITYTNFFNNTATRGGAIYYNGKALTLRDAKFQFNKAETGSAIYASDSGLSITSTTFLDNQARASALIVSASVDGFTVIVNAIFEGNDNLINAIYTLNTCNLNDVTYWAENGLANSNTANPKVTDLEAGINITVELYDSSFKPVTAINVTNVNGQAVIAIPNVKNGRYFIVVRHNEDTYYTELSNNEVVQVSLLDAPIDLSVHDIFYKENATINVHLPGDATGNVTFEIDGVNYTTENLTNAFASAVKSGLKGGVHNVTVYYSGDESYLKNSTNATFTVKPIPSEIVIVSDGGDYKENIPVNVTVGPEEVTGRVIITIEDEFGATLTINDTVELQTVINTLNAGTYNITAYYVGDNNYLPSTNQTTFTVNPIDLNPVVTATNVTTAENTTFTIIVPDDFEGKVNITVGNVSREYNIAGPTQITFVNLPEGNKTANVTFFNDNNYKNATVYPVNFTVTGFVHEESTQIMDVEINDISYLENATANITISSKISGNVVISVDGHVYTGVVTDGYALVNLSGLSGGVKTAIVNFTSSDNALNLTAKTKFVVNKLQSVVNITDEDRSVRIHIINGTKGNLSVYINDDKQTFVFDGEDIVLADVLITGNNTVIAIYDGNENYTGSQDNKHIIIAKKESLVNVTADPITYGSDAAIVVRVGEGQTGHVTINVNNKNYTAEIKDGSVTFEIPGLNAKEYAVNVT